MIDMHYIITDGQSNEQLLKQLHQLYDETDEAIGMDCKADHSASLADVRNGNAALHMSSDC